MTGDSGIVTGHSGERDRGDSGNVTADSGERDRRAGHVVGLTVYDCRRRLNLDPPCRLNFDPGMDAGIVDADCG